MTKPFKVVTVKDGYIKNVVQCKTADEAINTFKDIAKQYGIEIMDDVSDRFETDDTEVCIFCPYPWKIVHYATGVAI